MSKLRERMIEEMNMAGLSERTQYEYLRAVRQISSRYNISPDKISEEQVHQYLVDLCKNVARGTFEIKYYGIKFFYYRTLCVDWNLFSKKKSASPGSNVCHAL